MNERTGMNLWPDKVRFHMIEKSNFYPERENVYQYGFYDGYQFQNEKILKAIELIQKARSNDGQDSFLQDAIIALL